MPKSDRMEIIRQELPDVIQHWLLKRKLLDPGEDIEVHVTIVPPTRPLVMVTAAQGKTEANRGTRANPKERTDPALTDADWEKIFAHPWKHDCDKVILETLRSRGNSPVTHLELARILKVDLRHGSVDRSPQITQQLKKLGLGDLRLLSNGLYGEDMSYRIYRML